MFAIFSLWLHLIFMKINIIYPNKILLWGALMASTAVMTPYDVRAQDSDTIIVNEPSAADDLRDAIIRIGRSPTDSSALYDAGDASLRIGDAIVALDFFKRAERIEPSSSRIKIGLAKAQLNLENPVEALRLFDLAQSRGALAKDMAFDRGLAYDLIGNFSRAQQEYSLASGNIGSEDDKNALTIRQAISYSLAGNHDYADGLLLPLIEKNDPIAWRTRSFLLAARGDDKESYKIAQSFLSAIDAQKLRPYLKTMDKLTGAQQASAVHFGNFPATNIIGKDSDIIRTASANTDLLRENSSDRLTPVGKPLGQDISAANSDRLSKQKGDDKKSGKSKKETKSAQIADVKIIEKVEETVKIASVEPIAQIAQKSVADNQLAAGAPIAEPGFSSILDVKTAQLPQINNDNVNAARSDNIVIIGTGVGSGQKSADVADLSSNISDDDQDTDNLSQATFNPIAISAAETENDAEKGLGLDAFIASLEIPEEDQAVVPTVNLEAIKAEQLEQRRIEKLAQERTEKRAAEKAAADKRAAERAATQKAAEDAKRAEAEKNKARYWVQIATGRDVNALKFDYRRISRKQADLFKGKSGSTSKWGQTNRLVVGPFDDLSSAKTFESEYRKGGSDGFVWRSGDGTIVDGF